MSARKKEAVKARARENTGGREAGRPTAETQKASCVPEALGTDNYSFTQEPKMPF